MEVVKVAVNGGLSVLSAFANGFGSAVAIELPMSVTVTRKSSTVSQKFKVLSKTIEFLSNEFGISKNYEFTISSTIPSGRGFKSSSALTLSAIKGVLEIEDMKISEEELLRLSAQASIYNGTSLTGAMDDLCSSLYGGLCLTDNINRRVIIRREVEKKDLVIAFSKSSRKTSSLKKMNFDLYRKKADRILEMVKENRILDAMETNGYLFGSIFGMDRKIVSYLFSAGATYSGVSGKGPGIFGIFEDQKDAIEALKNFPYNEQYETIRSSLSNKGIQVRNV